MELLLMAVATCSGMDIMSILDKMKITYDRFQILVHGEQAKVAKDLKIKLLLTIDKKWVSWYPCPAF